MNKSVLLIMGGALLVAIVVALLVQAKLGPSKPADAGPSSQILVANKQLPTGTMLSADDVRWQDWPESGVFTGMIQKKDYPEGKQPEVFNTPLRRTIENGEPITTQALIADVKGGNSFLAASISPGMRAVSIPVTLETSAGGFVQPGDHVDIIVAYSGQLPADAQNGVADAVISRFASQTILSDVKVLAVDQAYKTDTAAADSGQGKNSVKNVTLEVSREGAETVALGKQIGDLSLALRRIGDIDTPETIKTPITTDATTLEVLRKLNSMVIQKKSNATVRIYGGTGVQNVPVRSLPSASGQ